MLIIYGVPLYYRGKLSEREGSESDQAFPADGPDAPYYRSVPDACHDTRNIPSGATIVGALMLGISRGAAAEFTFFLAIPVMFGASALKLLKFGFNFTGMQAAILIVGMAVSFIVSVIAIKFLLKYIKNHDFKVFGYYRIVLGVIVFLYFGITTMLS